MSTVLLRATSLGELMSATPDVPKSSSIGEIHKKLHTADTSAEEKELSLPHKDIMLKIHSNFARDRLVSINDSKLLLHFDLQGYSFCPKHLFHHLELEMKFKPGRYRVVDGGEPTTTVVEEQLNAAILELTEVAPDEDVAAEEVEDSPLDPAIFEDSEFSEKSTEAHTGLKRGRSKKTTRK